MATTFPREARKEDATGWMVVQDNLRRLRDTFDKYVASVVPYVPTPIELDYQQITANQTIAGTAEASATAIVTSASVVYDGVTPIILAFDTPFATTDGTDLRFQFHDDTANVSLGINFRGGAYFEGLHKEKRLIPAAGARVYSVRAWRVGGTTAATVITAGAGGAGNFDPSYLRIVRAT